MIYFDNAATTLPKPKEVGEAILYSLNNFGNPSRGGHSYSLDSARILYETRELLGVLFNIKNPLNIAFTANSTMSLNMAILGLNLKEGDEVITSTLEHNSVLRSLYKLEKKGIKINFVNSNKHGSLKPLDIEKKINTNTKLIIVTHGSNLTGNLVDIEKIGTLSNKYNLIFIVDASQTAGVFSIDVIRDKIDILCFTGHKGLMGPTGTGGIYLSPKINLNSFIVGGSGSHSFERNHPSTMPDKLEGGTPNFHGIAGLNASLKYIINIGMDNIREKELSLTKKFYLGIKDIPNIKIYGDFKSFYRAPIVALNFNGVSSTDLAEVLLEDYGIAIRSGIHCAPLVHIDFKTNESGMVRFSFSHFNTEAEIKKAIFALKEIEKTL